MILILGTGHFMVKPTVGLDILREGWYERLSSWHKLFEYGRLEGLGVVTLHTRHSFAHLEEHDY